MRVWGVCACVFVCACRAELDQHFVPCDYTYVCVQGRAGSTNFMPSHYTYVCVCRAELDQQAAEVERQRRQLTGAARTQAQLSQLETELARREQDLKVACASRWMPQAERRTIRNLQSFSQPTRLITCANHAMLSSVLRIQPQDSTRHTVS